MHKSTFKTILIALLLVVMTANLTVMQFNLAMNNTIFNPSFYDEIFLDLRFYEQLRQWMLLRLTTELPHGREGLAYFQKGLTDVWLRQELILIMERLSVFLNDKTEELPTLRIYKFKEAVMEHMYEYGNNQNKEEILDFWLGPLPHVVRIQDVTSIGFLHNVKYIMALLTNAMNISLILVFAFFVLLYAVTGRIRDTLLCFSASLFASGLLSLGIAFLMGWLINYETSLQFIQTSMIAQGFHRDNVNALFDSIIYTIISRINMVSLLKTLIGFLSICIIPLDMENI